MKLFVFACFSAILLGCSEPQAEFPLAERELQSVDSQSPDVELKSLSKKALRPPMNCPIVITAVSDFSEQRGRPYLHLSLDKNANFDNQKIDSCNGDIKNLWPDLSRFEAEIESHAPYVEGWFNTSVIMRHFPKTERELKRFIDDASKAKSLPEKLNNIDRSNLEGGLAYHNQIRSLIRQHELVYWDRFHAPILRAKLSKFGRSRFHVGNEKLAYCYHPHTYCRGYGRLDGKNLVAPQSYIGVESEFDLEYLWSAIGSYGFEMNAEMIRPN